MNGLIKFNDDVALKKSILSSEVEHSSLLIEFIRDEGTKLISLYEDEFKDLFEKRGWKARVQILEDLKSNLPNIITKFEVSGDNLIITQKDGTTLLEPLASVKDFVKKFIKLNKDDPYYYLLLGFFRNSPQLELIQLYTVGNRLALIS